MDVMLQENVGKKDGVEQNLNAIVCIIHFYHCAFKVFDDEEP